MDGTWVAALCCACDRFAENRRAPLMSIDLSMVSP
jgi:hypothetical protein